MIKYWTIGTIVILLIFTAFYVFHSKSDRQLKYQKIDVDITGTISCLPTKGTFECMYGFKDENGNYFKLIYEGQTEFNITRLLNKKIKIIGKAEGNIIKFNNFELLQ